MLNAPFRLPRHIPESAGDEEARVTLALAKKGRSARAELASQLRELWRGGRYEEPYLGCIQWLVQARRRTLWHAVKFVSGACPRPCKARATRSCGPHVTGIWRHLTGLDGCKKILAGKLFLTLFLSHSFHYLAKKVPRHSC